VKRPILTQAAEEDLFQIWTYLLAEAGTSVANRVEKRIIEHCYRVGRSPGIGHRRSDLTQENVFFWRVHPYEYVVVYRKTSPVEIVRILHAKRDLQKFLG
jgi:plasmid stabilization system protein ParE